MNNSVRFDRPVIILAAPRSGSTLLFETLAQSEDLWTIGGESHALFESIDRFNPTMGVCDSNALAAGDATSVILNQIRFRFFHRLRNTRGQSFHAYNVIADTAPRLLEKTPKNALRVSLLTAIFPDALFVYLYRNPRENISSMMDAWESGRFVTYKSLKGRRGSWSLLLPPDWQSYNNASLAATTAFQWQSANMAILSELQKIERHRWITVSHGQQTQQAIETVRRICHFCDVSPDAILNSISNGVRKQSRYTLTAPAKDKWHKNAAALNTVLPELAETMTFIRMSTDGIPAEEFDLSVDASLLDEITQQKGESE